MGDLKGFLIDLALKADLSESYARDPHGTLARSGLSGDEQAAVLSGDSALLRTALGRPDNDCMSQTAIAVRHADTGRTLRLAEILPLEKTVTLTHGVEMELASGVTKTYAKGAVVTRHRQVPKRAAAKRPKKRRG